MRKLCNLVKDFLMRPLVNTDAYNHKAYLVNGYTITIRLHRLLQHDRPLELSARPQRPAAVVGLR